MVALLFLSCGRLTATATACDHGCVAETFSCADLLRVTVEAGRFPLVRLEPTVGPERRSGTRGPIHAPSDSADALRRRARVRPYLPRPLLEDLRSLAATRCHLAGAVVVAARIPDTWRAVFQIPASDLSVVVAALEALLVGDELPLRDYLTNPPPLARPGEVPAPAGRQPG